MLSRIEFIMKKEEIKKLTERYPFLLPRDWTGEIMNYYDSDDDLEFDANELADLFLELAKNPKDVNELYTFSYKYIPSVYMSNKDRDLLVDLAFEFVMDDLKHKRK